MHIDKIQTLIEQVNDRGVQLTNILTQIRELGGVIPNVSLLQPRI